MSHEQFHGQRNLKHIGNCKKSRGGNCYYFCWQEIDEGSRNDNDVSGPMKQYKREHHIVVGPRGHNDRLRGHTRCLKDSLLNS